MRISDWSSDVCSSDLGRDIQGQPAAGLVVQLIHFERRQDSWLAIVYGPQLSRSTAHIESQEERSILFLADCRAHQHTRGRPRLNYIDRIGHCQLWRHEPAVGLDDK